MVLHHCTALYGSAPHYAALRRGALHLAAWDGWQVFCVSWLLSLLMRVTVDAEYVVKTFLPQIWH